MFFLYYYTIFRTPPLFQTEPLGNPAGDVGMLTIVKQFTNVLFACVAHIFFPNIITSSNPQALLEKPPNIEELLELITLLQPLSIEEYNPVLQLFLPPNTDEKLFITVL